MASRGDRLGGWIDRCRVDPVTNRFRATLSIRDARVWYSGGGESGDLIFHTDQKTQVLRGTLLRPASGGAPSLEIPLRLERRAGP